MSISKDGDSGGMTILVVEDEFIVREDIARYLRDAGWVVVEAESGHRAVAMCRSDTPVDVLFTDIQLNDSVNGWEVAEAFRAARGKFRSFTPPEIRLSLRGAFPAACISISHISWRIF